MIAETFRKGDRTGGLDTVCNEELWRGPGRGLGRGPGSRWLIKLHWHQRKLRLPLVPVELDEPRPPAVTHTSSIGPALSGRQLCMRD